MFTSFGDQGTPTLGKVYSPPAGVTLPSPPYVNDNLGSPAAADTTAGVERVQPLFHLFNGDLCYANLSVDRVRTWSDFWENNSRSARNRPLRDAANSYGFAAFTVDPGAGAGGQTSITVTYYEVVGTGGALRPFETFTLTRRRSDGPR